jgi:hypothetical protein
MGIVRITKDLKTTVCNAALATLSKQHDAARAPLDNGWGLTLYHKAMAPYLPLLTQLPEHWCRQEDTLAIRSVNVTVLDSDPLHDTVARVTASLDQVFNLGGPHLMPLGMFLAGPFARQHSSASTWNVDCTSTDDPELQEFARLVKERNLRILAVNQRTKEFVHGVEALLSSHATLAPAVKAWPPLWDLLDEDTKERARAVRVKRPVEEQDTRMEPVVDTNKLTAIAAMAKLGA